MRAPLSLFGAALLMGCSATVGASSDVDADTTGPVTAVVVVERVQQGDASRVSAIARFVRVRGGAVDERALQTVGAATEIPAVGACLILGEGDETAIRGVELQDVGAVTLEASSSRIQLAARQVPDPVGRVTGVFYFAPTDVQAVVPSARVALHVQGAGEVAPFSVATSTPQDLGEIRVGGQDMSRPVVLSVRSGSTELSWDAADDPSSSTFYVDVSDLGAKRLATRCAFPDTGRAVLPGRAVSGDAGQISIHRVRRERFAVRGVEPGELRFDFSRTTSYVRR